MWKVYDSAFDAYVELFRDGFRWSHQHGQFRRGIAYISQARVTVEQCNNGRWIVMQAPINAVM